MGHPGTYGYHVQKLKKEKAPRGGQAWLEDELVMLVHEYRNGMQPLDMAALHGRTPAACVSKLTQIGILIADGGAYWERPKEPYVTVREMMNWAKDKT